jgi:hypothetical protein
MGCLTLVITIIHSVIRNVNPQEVVSENSDDGTISMVSVSILLVSIISISMFICYYLHLSYFYFLIICHAFILTRIIGGDIISLVSFVIKNNRTVKQNKKNNRGNNSNEVVINEQIQ